MIESLASESSGSVIISDVLIDLLLALDRIESLLTVLCYFLIFIELFYIARSFSKKFYEYRSRRIHHV